MSDPEQTYDDEPVDNNAPVTPTRSRMEVAALRQNQALELRLAGMSYSQIAERVGYTASGPAFKAVQTALKRDFDTRNPVELRDKFRTLSLARCERMIRGVWLKAAQGDPPAIDRALRIMEREARLLGLDPPQQVVLTDATRSSLVAMLDDMERMVIDAEVVGELPPSSPNGD